MNENKYGNNNFSRRPAQIRGPQQGENVWGGRNQIQNQNQNRGYQNQNSNQYQNQNQQNTYNVGGAVLNNGYNNRGYNGDSNNFRTGGSGGDAMRGGGSYVTGYQRQQQNSPHTQQQQQQQTQENHQYQNQQQQQQQYPYMRPQMHQNDPDNQYVSQYSQSHGLNQNQNISYIPPNRGGVQNPIENQSNMHTQYYNPYAYQAQTLTIPSQRDGAGSFNNQMSHMTFNQSSDGIVRGGVSDGQYRMPGQGQVQGSNQQGQGQGVTSMSVRTAPNNARPYVVPNGVQVFQGQNQSQGPNQTQGQNQPQGQNQGQGQGQNYVPQQQHTQDSYNSRVYVPRNNE